MCNKALDNYSSVKAVNTCPSTIQFVPDQYKNQKMCNKVVFNSFPDVYKTQEMCEVLFLKILF